MTCFYLKKNELEKSDYLFFFNINLVCRKPIGEEILPTDVNDGLMVCSHPGYYNKPRIAFPYDNNPNSTAYIPPNLGTHYAPGGFNGGKTEAFLKLAEICSKNIHTDLSKKIIAAWHDESHLNKYIIDKNPLIIPINYMYPKAAKWLSKDNPYAKNIKIELREKVNYGGHYYLRGIIDIRNTKFNKLKYRLLRKFAKSKEDYDRYSQILKMLYFG